METLYSAKTYREFLVKLLDSEIFGRGGRSALARHLGVSLSVVSQALSGRQHFTLEQSLKAGEYVGLGGESLDYFVQLVLRDRAGSVALRGHFQSGLDRILERRRKIKNRIREAKARPEADLVEYYGSWLHVAVHMSLRNPKIRTVEDLSLSLGVSRSLVRESIAVLEKIRLIERDGERWRVNPVRHHSGKRSPALRSHHTNWRLAAVRSLDEGGPNDLHFSSVMSIDEKAWNEIKDRLLSLVEGTEPTIRSARDETVVVLNLDLFGLGKDHPRK